MMRGKSTRKMLSKKPLFRSKDKKNSRTLSKLPQNIRNSNEQIYENTEKFEEPEDKLTNLTQEELEESHLRVLKASNPNAPSNIVLFMSKTKEYTKLPNVQQTEIHFKEEGYLIHKKSEEARLMQEEAESKKVLLEKKRKEERGDDSSDEELEDTVDLVNQFNFSERAVQTFNNPKANAGVKTEAPPMMHFCASATQWEIYDTYVEYIAQQKELNKKKSKNKEENEEVVTLKLKKDTDILHSGSMMKSVKLIERMINQNSNDELLYDFKFWEDDSDKFNPQGGSLLPLWKFSSSKTRRKHVTGLCWNNFYTDLFAVGYGSYDFEKQVAGTVNCFSLKNPSHPEYTFNTKVGITSLDFHEQHRSLLCVGLYDGNVAMYDVRMKGKPITMSSIKNNKHTDAVWHTKWDYNQKELGFHSISSDGRVSNWKLHRNELQNTDIMKLRINSMQDVGLAGGTCFDFNKQSPNKYLVGTEEGVIQLCSRAYNSKNLKSYYGHNMSVYTVKWNNIHNSQASNNLFLSASADWSIKLWDESKSEPLMSFDMGSSVGDVDWAPYSATVFAAVTDAGHVVVYDLSVNKHDSMCDQPVVRKAKLTHLAFNKVDPIIIVGDDKGLVQTLKLSPNLKKKNSTLDIV